MHLKNFWKDIVNFREEGNEIKESVRVGTIM